MTDPEILREVFTTSTGEVCGRDDLDAAHAEIVWRDEHRTYADLTGDCGTGRNRLEPSGSLTPSLAG